MKTMRHILMAGTVALFAPMAAAYAAPPADTIVVGISADASTFDPPQISSRDNSNIASHIFGTLTSISPEGKVEPGLASSYVEAEDGLSITYTLPSDLTCEDGEVLNAEDVAYTFTRAADPANAFTGSTPGFVFSSIGFKGAEAISDSEVKIDIAARNPIAVSLIGEVLIHCKDSYEKMSLEDASSKPVASGSYRLVSWDRGSQVVLEKIKEPGTFKTIIYRIIPEASTRSAELIAGNVDIITNVAPDQVEAINGKPFELAGFDWDYSGTVSDWRGGTLDAPPGGCRMLVRFAAAKTAPGAAQDAVSGDQAFSSDDPKMRAVSPAI